MSYKKTILIPLLVAIAVLVRCAFSQIVLPVNPTTGQYYNPIVYTNFTNGTAPVTPLGTNVNFTNTFLRNIDATFVLQVPTGAGLSILLFNTNKPFIESNYMSQGTNSYQAHMGPYDYIQFSNAIGAGQVVVTNTVQYSGTP
jgi:hypothetical protein